MIGTLLWYGDFPFRGAIKKLCEIGFDYFELSLDYPLPDICDYKELRDYITDLGIGIAFHAPLDVFTAQPRDEIFRASLRVFRRCLKFASKFDTLYFNFHINYAVSTYEFLDVKEKIIKNGIRACKEAVKLGREFGFDVCIEYDWRFDERFLIDGLKITLDIGHFVLNQLRNNNRNYLKSLRDFVKKFDDKILVLHLHDCNTCELIDHLSLGVGDLNLKEILKIVGVRRYILLETFWRDREGRDIVSYEDLSYSLNTLKSLMSDEELRNSFE